MPTMPTTRHSRQPAGKFVTLLRYHTSLSSSHACFYSHSGGGWGKTLAFGAASWFLGGKIHSKRAVSKVNQKNAKDQKEIYKKFYTEIINLQTQNAELQQLVDYYAKRQQDTDWEIADIDRDNKVSRAEFNVFRNNYLQKHPEMVNDFAKFEDFDPDHNGQISRQEYDAYYRTLQYS